MRTLLDAKAHFADTEGGASLTVGPHLKKSGIPLPLKSATAAGRRRLWRRTLAHTTQLPVTPVTFWGIGGNYP